MTNQPTDTREAAIEQVIQKELDMRLAVLPETNLSYQSGMRHGIAAGFVAGAASVDRVEIVSLLEKVKGRLDLNARHFADLSKLLGDSSNGRDCHWESTHNFGLLREIDAVIAAMEKGNGK